MCTWEPHLWLFQRMKKARFFKNVWWPKWLSGSAGIKVIYVMAEHVYTLLQKFIMIALITSTLIVLIVQSQLCVVYTKMAVHVKIYVFLPWHKPSKSWKIWFQFIRQHNFVLNTTAENLYIKLYENVQTGKEDRHSTHSISINYLQYFILHCFVHLWKPSCYHLQHSLWQFLGWNLSNVNLGIILELWPQYNVAYQHHYKGWF